MPARDTVLHLTSFEGRRAGSDAERRAARWLVAELESPFRQTRIETFWCRPNWAVAHAWHVALALAGSLVSVGAPRPGIGLLAVALVSIVADALTGVSPGRRLTPERASQNVIATPRTGTRSPGNLWADPPPAESPPGGAAPATRLIITANLDTGRMGLIYRSVPRRLAAHLRMLAGPLALGWLGWLAVAVIWLLAVAGVRAGGTHGTGVSILQFLPTVALVIALALLLEQAGSAVGPGASDNAAGAAVALALVRALDAAPPRHLAVELVLTGAGDAQAIGLSRHLRARRRELRPENTVVLGIGPAGTGAPHWWTADGPLVPLRHSRPLLGLCAQVAREQPHLHARPHRARGTGQAFPARLRRLTATTIGGLDRHGLPGQSHQPGDIPEHLDPASLDRLTEYGLILVDALDAYVGRRRAAPEPVPVARG
jgi:peptidase M28-like protein